MLCGRCAMHCVHVSVWVCTILFALVCVAAALSVCVCYDSVCTCATLPVCVPAVFTMLFVQQIPNVMHFVFFFLFLWNSTPHIYCTTASTEKVHIVYFLHVLDDFRWTRAVDGSSEITSVFSSSTSRNPASNLAEPLSQCLSSVFLFILLFSLYGNLASNLAWTSELMQIFSFCLSAAESLSLMWQPSFPLTRALCVLILFPQKKTGYGKSTIQLKC